MKKLFKILKFIILTFFILALLLVLLLYSTMNIMKKNSEPKLYYDRGISIVPESDYILVPGAKILFNVPDVYLRHRLDYAYQLYKAEKAPKIILSGGFDKTYGKYEPAVMESYLISLGVKKEDIISDLSGNNTYETLKRTKEFVGEKSVIFCSQELYTYRAIYISEKLDLNMVAYCSNPVIYTKVLRDNIRESFSQVKAILNCTLFSPTTRSLSDLPFYFEKEDI